MTTYSFYPAILPISSPKFPATMCSVESPKSVPEKWTDLDTDGCHDTDDSDGGSDCHVLSLYPEILTHIFQFLDVPERGRIAQVCRYWRDVVYDKAVWRGVEAKMHLRKSGNSLVYQSLAKRGIYQVQVLSLKRSLRELVGGLPGIMSLKLSGCYSVTDSTLASAFSMTAATTLPGGISSQLTQLTTLDLSLCKQMSDVSLARIANRAPNLRNLELGGCCQVSDCGLLIISWGLKKLQRLNLRSCYLITDTGIGFLTGIVTPNHLSETRIQNFLKNLGILEVSTEKPANGAEPPALSASNTVEPSVSVSVSKHREKSSARTSAAQVTTEYHRKRRLDDLLFVQSQSGPQQKCVICQQVGFPLQQQQQHPDGANLGSNNSRVKLHGRRRGVIHSTSVLHSTSTVNTPGVTTIAHYRQPPAYFQEFFLEKISPSTSTFGTKDLQFLGLQDCQKLSDECLGFIGQGGLPKLQSINLSFCIHISDSGLKELAKLTSISEVNLRSCDNVTDTGLLNLSDCGSRLRCLDVSFCDKVGNSGLGYISQYMTRLKTLSLSACDISDQGLMRVANVLTSLETLNLGQCSKITDEALKIISEKCVHIKYIDLYGCTQISREGLNMILKMPSIKSLNLGLWHWR